MRRSGSTARLVIALSVAATLAVFLLYTSLAGGATLSLQPSELAGRTSPVYLGGLALGPVRGDAHGKGMHFTLRDINGTARVPVLYRGSVPDLFRAGRNVYLRGQLRHGVFVADPGTLVTKCPSKYVPAGGT
jgi:cytochrome c-type biogenesis protein CcmE